MSTVLQNQLINSRNYIKTNQKAHQRLQFSASSLNHEKRKRKKSKERKKERKKEGEMKLVWSPETASEAYIDTVKSCKLQEESGEAELISAMAGGWNEKLIVEAYFHGCAVATSVGLAIAARHTGGRYICMVPDERSRLDYVKAMHAAGVLPPPEVVVGEPEEVMTGLVGIDFLVVDGRRRDFGRAIRFAKLSHRGAVLVCRNASQRTMAGFRWGGVLGSSTRVVRSVALPVGKGLDIAYVANSVGATKGAGRWIRYIDHQSGEEHLIRQ